MEEALFKGLVAAGYTMKREGGVLISVRDTDKSDLRELVKEYVAMGFPHLRDLRYRKPVKQRRHFFNVSQKAEGSQRGREDDHFPAGRRKDKLRNFHFQDGDASRDATVSA